jgi:hypothetical protein
MLFLFAGGAPIGTMLDYVAPAKVEFYNRADLGITLNGSDVSQWDDQSGAGRHWTQGTAARQPVYNATGGPDGKPCVTGQTAEQHFLLISGYTRPAPATTPTVYWIVARQTGDSVANAGIIYGGNYRLGVVTPVTVTQRGFRLNAGTSVPASPGVTYTNNTWALLRATFLGGTTDSLHVGSASATGLNAGNNATTGNLQLLGVGTTVNFEGDVAEVLCLNAEPSAGEISAMIGYVTAYYNGAVQV